jgi:hypothetical protein
MQLLEIYCPSCGYRVSLLVGTQQPSQTYSDLNEDFAFYQLFFCPADKSLHSMNVHDREFEAYCPEHATKMEPLPDVPTSCPVCGGPIEVVKKDILKPEVGGE